MRIDSLDCGDEFYFSNFKNLTYVLLDKHTHHCVVQSLTSGIVSGVSNYREVFLTKKKEEKMTKINWKNTPSKVLKFSDLSENESFRNVSPGSRGAVYRKVRLHQTNRFMQMEEATGVLWEPTHSPVERVTVEVNIETTKPSIY